MPQLGTCESCMKPKRRIFDLDLSDDGVVMFHRSLCVSCLIDENWRVDFAWSLKDFIEVQLNPPKATP